MSHLSNKVPAASVRRLSDESLSTTSSKRVGRKWNQNYLVDLSLIEDIKVEIRAPNLFCGPKTVFSGSGAELSALSAAQLSGSELLNNLPINPYFSRTFFHLKSLDLLQDSKRLTNLERDFFSRGPNRFLCLFDQREEDRQSEHLTNLRGPDWDSAGEDPLYRQSL